MIPRYLVMEGLYSYRRQATIDFRRLTAARLFGIFGAVGSGKSSILEAISLAVYGDTTRMNSRNDNRNYNILNLRSDRLWIDFRFLNFDGEEYRFTAETRRNSRSYDQVGALQRSAYRRENDEWVPLESVSGEDVVGLSYDNFRRTIIIPQGRFQEFLQLGVRDRTEMLKELFNLDRFDLYRPAKNLAGQVATELTATEAALGEIPADLDERAQAASEELLTARERREEVSRQRQERSSWHSRLRAVADLEGEREDIAAERRRVERDAEGIEELRRRKTLLETVRDELAQPFREVAAARQRHAEAEKHRAAAVHALGPAAETRQAWDHRLAELELASEKREREEARKEAIRKGIAVFQEYNALRKRRVTLDGEIRRAEAAEAELAEYAAREEELRARIDDVWEALPRPELIEAAGEYRRLRDEGDVLVEEEARIVSRFSDLVAECVDAGVIPEENGLLPATVENYRTGAERLTTAFHEHRRRGAVHTHLAMVAEELEEGSPCPLCGSIHHPRPFSAPAGAEEDALQGGEPSKEGAERLFGELHRIIAAHEQLTDRRKSATEKVHTILGTTAVTEDELSGIAADLPATRKRMGDLERDRKKLYDVQAGKDGAQRNVAALATQIAGKKGELTAADERLSSDLRTLPEDIRTILDRHMQGEDQTTAVESLATEAGQIETRLQELTVELKRAREERDAAQREETRISSAVEERTESLKRTTEAKELAESEFKEALARAGSALASSSPEGTLPGELRLSREEELVPRALPALIEETGSLSAITERIDNHERRLSNLASRSAALERRAREITPPELDIPLADALADAAAAVIAAEEELQQLTGHIGSLEQESESLQRLTARRTQLADRRKGLTARRETLSTLLNLFVGSKFVSYVASVFLEQLVAAANHRFRRLTRNRLELALRGDHDFEVVDYLNGGRRRSVKTLSGGQTFQAALCLALALVDSIDHRAGGETPGFFFLDEGFGSLDEESLRDVFATLTDLRRENRIVGIISHVESLQQEIDTFLRITADQEEGSVVTWG